MGKSLPLLAVGVVCGILAAGTPRPRGRTADFDLSQGLGAPPAPSSRTRSGRLQRALETIAAGREGGDREAVDRARRTAARAYQAGGDVSLAAAHLRSVAGEHGAIGSGEAAARARLELAHLARRGGDVGRARVGYLRALLDVDLPRRAREAAVSVWAGMERDSGDVMLGEALRVVLALDARRPRDRVRSWSALVRAREVRSPKMAWWLSHVCATLEVRGDADEELLVRLVTLGGWSR